MAFSKLWKAILVFTFLLIGSAYSKEHALNPISEEMDVQRIHDDEAGVTYWILYVPNTSRYQMPDHYSMSCLPNTVIKPEAIKK